VVEKILDNRWLKDMKLTLKMVKNHILLPFKHGVPHFRNAIQNFVKYIIQNVNPKLKCDKFDDIAAFCQLPEAVWTTSLMRR